MCAVDRDIEDVAAFGDRLHLRLRREAQTVERTALLSACPGALAAAGVEVFDLRSIQPTLEDVFIALQEGALAMAEDAGNDMAEMAVRAEHLSKKFGDFMAVNDISFEVPIGEVVGYLGPNGSGKTTTMRMLLGLLSPTTGSAQVMGYDVHDHAQEIRSLVGYMSQKFALYDELTVLENLVFYAGMYGLRGVQRRQHVDEVVHLVGLEAHQTEQAGALSTGWRQRLALAIALVHKPAAAPARRAHQRRQTHRRARIFWDLIDGLAQEGTTVFVTTHYMDEAEYCGRLGIMDQWPSAGHGHAVIAQALRPCPARPGI